METKESLSDERPFNRMLVKIKQEIIDKMPLGEIPADEDVAEAVVFFCSDRSRMITGQTLMVNSGELLP